MNNLPKFYNPENQTHEENRSRLYCIYLELYPWHGTDEAQFYDYPNFYEAVVAWADDDFYIQHLTAKVFLEVDRWLNG